MPDDAELRTVLEAVVDPIIGRPLGELGMLGALTIDDHAARVRVRLPADDYPRADELAARVSAAAGRFGSRTVDVELEVMDDDARRALADRLRPRATVAPAGGPGAAPNPFVDARTRVLAVSSGKGGVGKSSVTTNLAVALARAGHDVAAVDADVWGFSLPRMLGIDRPPYLVEDVIVPPAAHDVRLMSMGFFVGEDQPVIWRGPMLHKALEQFLTDVAWGEPDFLVIDMPPGTGDVSLSIAQFLPRAEVIVVTTPQPAAQRVAQRAAHMARHVHLDVVGVIENMSWFRGDDGTVYELFGSGGGEQLATSLDVPLLGRLPLVPELREGGDAGRPIVVEAPDSEAARAFATVAERLATDLAPSKRYRSELKIV